MIYGVGTDIVDRSRFAEHTGKLADRILTEKEFKNYNEQQDKIDFLAKTWAVKEATAKALGSGIGKQCSWKDLEVSRDQAGKPEVRFSGKELLNRMEILNINSHVSLSDEADYVVAFVVLDRPDNPRPYSEGFYYKG
jgi:holo-[acyl-carrier protein] synthase